MNAHVLERIPLAAIRGNPNQPRQTFDPVELEELAQSILAAGKLHQPITVRPIECEDEVRFEIVMGERRFRAHKLLAERGHVAFTSIVAHVETMSDREMTIRAIVENLQRADVNPVEEAFAFHRLTNDGMEDHEIGRLVGIAPHRVRERLALVQLDEQVLQLVRSGQLPPTSGVEIAKLPKHRQIGMVREISRGKVKTINEIRAAIEAVTEKDAQGDMLGDAQRATPAEVSTLSAMERKVEQVKAMVANGWKNGECVVARKVDPDRARRMAEQLAHVRLAISRMERDLRAAAVQGDMDLGEVSLV